ncbi:MAG: VWA domain-containing protein [Acidobacteriota bacterium]
MNRITALSVIFGLTLSSLFAQTQPSPQKPQQEAQEEILRITTELVQTDVVVTDKNDQLVTDLKFDDFEVYDNGKRQELKFMELVSIGSPRDRLAGIDKIAPGIDTSVARDVTAKDVRRVMAFVVDDVTIPAEDMARVRQMLSDFVENKMQEGDLVAIVRTVGGKGLLEQFTADRQILRRAIAQLGVRSIPPYLSFSGGDAERVAPPSPLADTTASETLASNTDFEGPGEGANQVPRAMLALSVSNYIIDSLRQIPGRKSLVLLSGGLPLFDLTRSGSYISDIGRLFRIVTDNATRSGVVINTMDVRGLQATGVVAKFQDTPGRSALGGGTFAGGDVSTVGRGYNPALLGERSLTEQLTLRELAGRTGGASVINSNNFGAGLDKILSRSRAYYRLAYRPSEPFDNKFHKVTIKVRRSGIHTYAAEGYFAREDKSAGSLTKEDEIIRAAISPLAKRDLDMAAELQYRFLPTNQAQLDINTFIDARKLQFTRSDDGKYHAALDVAGFVFDQVGRNRGGMSQTVSADLSEEDYQRAVTNGLSYTASTEAPPGYYQVRLVVREVSTGKIGSVSRYFEVPDLSNKQLTLSSIILYGMNPSGNDKNPQQLAATRVISRKQDLRYALVVYNAKLDNNKPQARSQLIISQGGRMLFKEPEQPVQTPGTAAGQFIKVGQLGLSKVAPGRYVLTLVVTDPLADKKRQIVSRSVDFMVVN